MTGILTLNIVKVNFFLKNSCSNNNNQSINYYIVFQCIVNYYRMIIHYIYINDESLIFFVYTHNIQGKVTCKLICVCSITTNGTWVVAVSALLNRAYSILVPDLVV